MNVVRKLFLFFSTFMLLVSLIILNTAWVVKNTVTDREVVKTIIKDSGFYDNIIDEIVKNVEKEIKSGDSQQNIGADQNTTVSSTPENGSPDIDIAILGRAANAVFTPENIQQKLEAVLDGTYNWLDGDTPDLQFILDLSQEKIALANSLADEATTRVNALPACSTDQLATIGKVDVFSVECIPPEVNAKITEFQQEFANSDEFLSDVVLSARDIKVEVDGVEKPFSEAVPSVPAWYQFAQQVAWFMLIAVLIWVLLVMFLSKDLRHGIKHAAVAFLVAGILVLLSAFGSSQIIKVVKVSSNSIEETIILPLANESIKHASQLAYSVSAIYIAIFGIAALYLYITRSKKEVVETGPSNNVENPDQKISENTDSSPDLEPVDKENTSKESESEKESLDKKSK